MELATEPTMSPEDWEKCRIIAKSPDRPASWPAGVYSISVKGLCLLGVDDRNRLYWDGERVPNLVLSRWQKIGAVILAISAAVAACAAAVSAYASLASLPA